MKQFPNTLQKYLLASLLTTTALLYQLPVYARPGTLSNIPLYLNTSVDPNIVFLTDDSGSMDWEIISTDADDDGIFTGTQPNGSNPAGSGSVRHRDKDEDGDADCSFGSGTFNGYIYIVEFPSNSYDDGTSDCDVVDEQEWRMRNSDFNPLYYNPTKTYKPWSGVNKAGVPFADIDITHAPDDPFDPLYYINLTRDNSNYINSTTRGTSDRDHDGQPDGFRYYTWSDNDGDGLFDNGEETEHLIKNEDAATQQNFANWFSYHRSREFVAKYAISKSVDSMVGTRVGYGTINNNDSVKVKVAAMNADPASGNKRLLYDQIFDTRSANGTPLRANLRDVGKYYECKTGNFFGVSGSNCPILSAADGGMCQQNFTILMTDGFYNGPSPSLSPSNPDYDNNTKYDGGSYKGSTSNTLADVAMHYYERDLNTSLSNVVPIIAGVDEADHQHMVTYTVAFGLTGSLDPFDTKTPGVASDTDPKAAGFSWPNPTTSDAAKIDDLWHAAYNGRGKFLSARDPDDLSNAIEDAMSSIADRVSSAAAVAFNSTSLSTNSEVYMARFTTNAWSGDVLSFDLDPLNGGVAGTANWSAATALDAQSPSSRVILTYKDITTTTGTGIPFKTLGDLSAKQQNDLNMGTSAADGFGQFRLDYLRGDRSNESIGKNFRARSTVLGDVIQSNPVYVGKPIMDYPDNFVETGYAAFKSTNASRPGVIYIGANDGMLHGFSEANGQELIAYVPNKLFSNSTTAGLHYLTNPSYVHRYYSDLTPVAVDVKLGGAWKTLLVGGLRSGGKGYFALDITEPTSFSDSNAANIVKWEFTDDNNANLGYTFSTPSLVRLNSGLWVAVTGNGYNNSGDGKAHLILINLNDGSQVADITAGSNGSLADPNGLSSPVAIDNDADGVADYAYAGDLFGDLWKFDLTTLSATPTLIFDGTDTQPITTRPLVVRHPSQVDDSTAPNVLIYFGTGQYIVDADKSTTATQTMYGIWDNPGTLPITSGSLVAQTITETDDLRLVTDNAVNYSSAVPGWKINLPTSGERIIVNPKARGDYLVFTTMIPETAECSYGGSGWIMAVKLANGGTPTSPVWDINNDDKFDDGDLVEDDPPSGYKVDDGIPNESKFLGDYIYVTDSSGDLDDGADNGDDGGDKGNFCENCPSKGRLSWREIRN